ncbi:hypothetical protein [Paraliomyxa miuraensis]|uniref:hypothetical protein n=1 Tax=Paraliomyxa miuraensis TaxID=376150 RepID=UPI00225AFB6D|nr:hypothetical protein [Paraliomyxa miuraensis]MCX4247957.1 hypothetical protein [Paraliomyxa miuraensis]
MDDRTDDPDRAAILARRQRFIALALSGLAVACGDDGPSPTPMPCLDVGPVTTSTAEDDGSTLGMTGQVDGSTTGGSDGSATGDDGDTTAGSSEGPSSSSASEGDAGASSTGGGSETDEGSTGRPMPCLGVMP